MQLAYTASHAAARIFRTEPVHSVKYCSLCADKARTQVSAVRANLSLEMQEDALAATRLTRFSIVIDGTPRTHSAEANPMIDTLSNTFRTEFQCRINRRLMYSGDIPATTINIRNELESIVRNAKIHDHLLVHVHSVECDIVEVFKEATVPFFVWIVSDNPSVSLTALPYQYTSTGSTTAQVLLERRSPVRIHHLCVPADTFLQVMRENRFRMSLARLLWALPDTATLCCSHPVQLASTFFGFG